MKPRSPEELAAIEKAMDDPRGAALSMFTLALAMRGQMNCGPHDLPRYAVEIVDGLFDELLQLSANPQKSANGPGPTPEPPKPGVRCAHYITGEIDAESRRRKVYRCTMDEGHGGIGHDAFYVPFGHPDNPLYPPATEP